MSKSLQISGVAWTVSVLGERALLIKPKEHGAKLSLIHHSTRMLEKAELYQLTDIIPAYSSIALIYDRLVEDPDKEVETIQEKLKGYSASDEVYPKIHKIPVCYELGFDWEIVEEHTGLNRKEIIAKHTASTYTVAMMGFVPGFLYLSGLSEEIACPRKNEPRTKIPTGSVGIGGAQTGVYSLESPGGWQIIGRTPHSFFNPVADRPSEINLADQVEFYSINEAMFKKLKAGKDSP